MIRCSSKPYEGTEKYIFISYAHKDNALVYPIVETLAGKGYRIWYDEGIDPGSEWPETIAEHLNNCEVCVAFLSENYLNSHNCRREINFALRKKKAFVSVVLEPVEPSLGMEMQLSATQSVSKYTFSDEEAFYEKLCSARFLGECLREMPETPKLAEDDITKAHPAPEVKTGGGSATEHMTEQVPGTEREPETEPKADADRKQEPVQTGKAEAEPKAGIDRKSGPAQTDHAETEPAAGTAGKQEKRPGEKEEIHTEEQAKKRRRIITIAAAAGVFALLLTVMLFRFLLPAIGGGGSNVISIAGKGINMDESSVTLSKADITADDVQNLASLESLKYLYFKGCSFEEGASAYLGELSETLVSLEFTECTGVGDYSAVSNLKSLEHLTIQNCGFTDGQLASIAFGDKMLIVKLNDNEELTDISPLKTASRLKQLQVDGTSVTDFAVLSECTALSTLSAGGNGIQDISSLANLGIVYLTLAYNQIADLSPLAGNQQITELDLSGNRISDIASLAGMTQLRVLKLNDNMLTSLVPLSECSNLTTVGVIRNRLTDLNGLEHALELKTINAAGNEISDISGLQNCTILSYVNLTGNDIEDISILQKSAATLTQVYLGGNRLADISALKGTAALQYLNLDGNEVTTLEPLAESLALTGLSAGHNMLTSASGLENAAKLRYLFLAYNQIEDAQALASMTAQAENNYYMIDLSHNAIQELSLGNSKTYDYLAVYDNPFVSLDFLQSIKGTWVYFNYHEDVETEGFAVAFSHLNILDCPLDRQVAVKTALAKIVSYVTAEEAEEDVESKKTAVITGE